MDNPDTPTPSSATEPRTSFLEEKAFNALVGQVMKAMKGKANPGKVNEMMTEKLNA